MLLLLFTLVVYIYWLLLFLSFSQGTEVLLSFREACGIWISEKQRREESEYEWRKRYRSDSTIRDGKSNVSFIKHVTANHNGLFLF